ncbi:MAG: YhcH/YjgK/YiaL family protein [Sphingobacteriaceae bacterium]
MIIDTIANIDRYLGIHPSFAKAVDFIKTQNLSELEIGKYPIDGDAVFALISAKDGVKAEEAKFEAHNFYIDIQLCLADLETFGWSPRETVKQPKADYDEVKDVTFFNDKPSTYFDLRDGQLAIFFPSDVHAPMIGEGPIRKLVIKIKI